MSTNKRYRQRGVTAAMAKLLFGLLFLRGICLAQQLPPTLRQALAHHLKASQRQLKSVEGGGIVTYVFDTNSREDITLVGITRIWAPPSAFLAEYEDIAQFEASSSVTATVKFSRPPQLSDLDKLKLSRQDAEELKLCKPGSCGFKLGDSEIQHFRSSVNWTAPDYLDQATGSFRQFWLDYVNRYQESGNAALLVYHDTSQYSRIADGLRDFLQTASILLQFSPDLVDWLRGYPHPAHPLPDEFLYWQSGTFGLKPVYRIAHVGVQRTAAGYGDAYVIASKMLYASHYFRSALEIRLVIPGQDQKIGGMHYLVTVQMSRVDGMGGFRGRFFRAVATQRARRALETHLAEVKRRVETGFNAKQ